MPDSNLPARLLAAGAAALVLTGATVLALAVHTPGDPSSGPLGGAILAVAALLALLGGRKLTGR